MKIFVLNLHKHRVAFRFAKIVAVALAVLLLCGIGINAYMSSGLYIEAMQEENEKNLIIIDAGHGGEDPGAIGVNGTYEKDLNFAIANEVGKILSDEGFAVIYTRTEDKLLYSEDENIYGIRKISDLKNRCKIAAEYPNALFISIHMNSYGNAKYSGLQVYYGTESDNSRQLASSIQERVRTDLQPNNKRVVKEGRDMYMLEHISNPCVIVECGFLTNTQECEKLSEKEYQKQLSLAIVYGIIDYKEKVSSY